MRIVPTPRTRSIATELLSEVPTFSVVEGGGVLREDDAGVAKLIVVERGKYTTSNDNPVTLMLGTIPVRVADLLGSTVSKEIRKGPMYWPWRRRIGQVMPDQRDTWWDLGLEGSPADTSGLAALRLALREHGLPSLAIVASERALLDAMVERFNEHGDLLPYGELRWFTGLARVLDEDSLADAGIAAMRSCGVEEESLHDDLQSLG